MWRQSSVLSTKLHFNLPETQDTLVSPQWIAVSLTGAFPMGLGVWGASWYRGSLVSSSALGRSSQTEIPQLRDTKSLAQGHTAAWRVIAFTGWLAKVEAETPQPAWTRGCSSPFRTRPPPRHGPHTLLPGPAHGLPHGVAPTHCFPNRPGCRAEESSQGVPLCYPRVRSGFQAQGRAPGLVRECRALRVWTVGLCL